MKFVIQRVKNANVEVDKKVVGEIKKGFLVLIGVTHEDNEQTADTMIKKMLNLRIFEDEKGKMNKSLTDVGGELLLISQFTLYANCKRGNRPDFLKSAKFDYANKLYEYTIEKCKEQGYKVETGIFGADMKVSLLNDGPVTIILDSEELN